MNKYIGKKMSEDEVNEYYYLKRHHAIFPEEIQRAREMAVPGFKVKIVDPKCIGVKTDIYGRKNEVELTKEYKITRVINNIIELENNMCCSIIEFTMYLRDPMMPIKRG